MFKIIKSIRAALRWNTALELTSKRNYSGAINKLELNEKLNNVNMVEEMLLKAYLLLKLEKSAECVVSLKKFFKLLEEKKHSKKVDEEYLKAYASWIVMSLSKEYSIQFSNYNIPKNIGELSEVSLKGVRPSLMRIFPLEVHRRWALE